MRCAIHRKRIHAWLDRPGAPMPDAVRSHLRDCPDCREFIRAWNAVELSLQVARQDAPGFGPVSSTAILARMERPSVRQPFWNRRSRHLALAGAACAAIAGLALFLAARGGLTAGPDNLATTAHGVSSQRGNAPELPGPSGR